jgi:hypothetical protein
MKQFVLKLKDGSFLTADRRIVERQDASLFSQDEAKMMAEEMFGFLWARYCTIEQDHGEAQRRFHVKGGGTWSPKKADHIKRLARHNMTSELGGRIERLEKGESFLTAPRNKNNAFYCAYRRKIKIKTRMVDGMMRVERLSKKKHA